MNSCTRAREPPAARAAPCQVFSPAQPAATLNCPRHTRHLRHPCHQVSFLSEFPTDDVMEAVCPDYEPPSKRCPAPEGLLAAALQRHDCGGAGRQRRCAAASAGRCARVPGRRRRHAWRRGRRPAVVHPKPTLLASCPPPLAPSPPQAERRERGDAARHCGGLAQHPAVSGTH